MNKTTESKNEPIKKAEHPYLSKNHPLITRTEPMRFYHTPTNQSDDLKQKTK